MHKTIVTAVETLTRDTNIRLNKKETVMNRTHGLSPLPHLLTLLTAVVILLAAFTVRPAGAAAIETVKFGTNWAADAGVAGGFYYGTTFEKTQDNLTFAVTAQASGKNPPLAITDDRLAVNGKGSGGGSNWVIDNNESITFTLSVAGKWEKYLQDLRLDSIRIQGYLGDGLGEWRDGVHTPVPATIDGSFTGYNYEGSDGNIELVDLTPLSLANVGNIGDDTWQLTIYGLSDTDHMLMRDITLAYSVPEPSTLGVFVLGIVCCVARRRRTA